MGKKFSKAYVFEPDDNNYVNCVRNINNHFSDLVKQERFQIIKAGLLDSVSDVDFIRWGNYGSRITKTEINGWSNAEGSNYIGKLQTIALDSFIPDNERITFLKLDVEGVEIHALNGAKRIITEQKPKIALSIYHRVEDLWEIPLLIKKFVPEYKLYVRHHSLALGDKILYATI